MEPTSVGAAAFKSVGKIGAAAVSRYRPAGVARVGSPEDRAQAYRRFLDATVHASINGGVHQLHVAAGSVSPESFADMVASGNELKCALDGVRLCAPDYVIAAAEDAFSAVHRSIEKVNAAESDKSNVKLEEVRDTFLEAARNDLNYKQSRWNLWRRWKERQFRKEQARKILDARPSESSAVPDARQSA
ncbi:hypothetical protein [Streptomyces sp. V17-9]|uniref:hypothetical protein n=1 Tax=Streptomyces sp. V17-9 TaxID=2831149 RepID=UPI001BAF3108|nr:hypothetical protein [Streptomyces sp. V17-9]